VILVLIPEDENQKRCPDCGELKPLTEFPRNKNSKDGRHTYCKPCHNARGRETKDRLYGGTRHYHLKHRYGIGADDVDAMVRAQGRICPVCGRPDPQHVDHDHESGEVRGILCFTCNVGLGNFGDDVERLRNAADYLEGCSPLTLEQRELDALAEARARELVGAG
jgi:hypothetical protein